MGDEELHSVMARSAFEVKMYNAGPLLEVDMLKKRAPLWREEQCEVKMKKHISVGLLLQVAPLKKCMPLWHKAHVQAPVQQEKRRGTFGS